MDITDAETNFKTTTNLKKKSKNMIKRKAIEFKSVEIKKIKLEQDATNTNITVNNAEETTDTKPKALGLSLETKIDLLNHKCDQLQVSVDALTQLIQSLVKDPQNEPTRKKIKEDPLFVLPQLPLRSTQSLRSFNKLLLTQEYLQEMGTRLTQVLCSTMSLNQMVKVLIRTIVNYDTLLLHTWTGKSGIFDRTKTKIAFSDYTGVMSLIKITINSVKEVTDDNLKKSVVNFLKRTTQNKLREERKVHNTISEPAISTDFSATDGTSTIEFKEESDEECYEKYSNSITSIFLGE